VRIPIFETKYVVCISSQVGCALACDFCMTGKMGFQRNLETWEVVDQVLQIRAEADRPVRGVVFMGMGEPLLNYANTTGPRASCATPQAWPSGPGASPSAPRAGCPASASTGRISCPTAWRSR